MKNVIVFFCCLLPATTMLAQNADYKLLNKSRIKTNTAGMIVLGSWGIANVTGGITSYTVAKTAEWKSFHGMNAVWGAVNGLIAAGGYMGACKEAEQDYNYDQALDRYKSSKRLYLINAGLDVLYIGIGTGLYAYAPNSNKPQMFSGFGKSIVFQGAVLLLFDGVMYGLHQGHNKKWSKTVSGLSMTGNSIGYTYHF